MTREEKDSLSGMATDIKWIREALEKDGTRIDLLEKDVAKAKGMGAVIALVTSAVITFIGKRL